MNDSQVTLIENLSRILSCPLVIQDIHRNHAYVVYRGVLVYAHALLPRMLEERLGEVLGTKSPVRIEREGQAVTISIPFEPPREIDFAELVKQDVPAGIPILAGIDMNDQVRWGNLAAVPHLFVVGASGSGKSNGVRCIVMSLHCTARNKVAITAIDIAKPRSFDFVPSDFVMDRADRPATAEHLLVKVKHEVQHRLTQAQNPPEQLQRVVIVDEVAELLKERPAVKAHLQYLAQVAREAKTSVILVCQNPADVPSKIRQELRCRAVYRLDDPRASKLAIGSHKALGLRQGELIFRFNGDDHVVRAPNMACPPCEDVILQGMQS